MTRKLLFGLIAVGLVASAAIVLWPEDDHSDTFAPVSEYRVDVWASWKFFALLAAAVVVIVVAVTLLRRRRKSR